jgi:hypothetical protein
MPPREPFLKLGEDYYVENGFVVFTEKYLLKRGYCCNSGCRHCPYKSDNHKPEDQSTEL